MLESTLLLQLGILKTFGLIRGRSISFRLEDNLFQIIEKNISLLYNSITAKTEVRSGEKDKSNLIFKTMFIEYIYIILI